MGFVPFTKYSRSRTFKTGTASYSARKINHPSSISSPELVLSCETAYPTHCEKFLKAYLAPYRVSGSKELFDLGDSEIREDAIWAAKHFEAEVLPKKLKVEHAKRMVSNGAMVQPTSKEQNIYERLRSVTDAIKKLELHQEELENELKLTIGDMDGIDGIATWRSQIRRGFDFRGFEQENKGFVTENEHIFRKYRTETISRTFLLK